MTTLEEVERLYYRAVHDAKLSEPKEGYLGPPGYSTEEFSRWARKVDVFRLSEGAADFALKQHEELVKNFGEYRRTVACTLSRLFSFDSIQMPGDLKDIGSCWDGSKVDAVNEMDSLYVIPAHHFTVRESKDKKGFYHVYSGKGPVLQEIHPRSIRDQFADKYCQLVSKMRLPDCLDHGGYRSQIGSHYSVDSVSACRRGSNTCSGLQGRGYSGVRYNGPAVTSQFLSKNKTLLTWDITPVVVFTDSGEITEELRQSIQPIIAENPDKMFPPGDIHLIPDATENLWRLSTAQIEADTLRVLSPEAPVKMALCFCKVLASRLKAWNYENGMFAPCAVDIIKELDKLTPGQEADITSAVYTLNRKMRFAHIWIPAKERGRYHEDKKSNISINNAAMKHILFTAAASRKGAFAPKQNMDLVLELIYLVFEVLGNPESYSSEHALLRGIYISHFSISPRVVSNKQALARDVSLQCRMLLHEAMTKALPHLRIEEFIDELNRCAVFRGELDYGEYSFEMNVNPWQHPIFDKNIHLLLGIFSSLCNSCGGVIYLMTESMEKVAEDDLALFKQRLVSLLSRRLGCSPKMRLSHTSVQLGTRMSWAMLRVYKALDMLKYPPTETIGFWSPVQFQIDLSGQVYVDDIPKMYACNTEMGTTNLPGSYNELDEKTAVTYNVTTVSENVSAYNAVQPSHKAKTEIETPMDSLGRQPTGNTYNMVTPAGSVLTPADNVVICEGSEVTTTDSLMTSTESMVVTPTDRGKTSTDSIVPLSAISVLPLENNDEMGPADEVSVDFSKCDRLDWSKNTKNWEKYVNIKEVTTDIIGSCPMWQPTQPMNITPDRGSVQYLFESEEDMEKTLSAVTTVDPGFATVCRTWRFLISGVDETEARPPGHICDIVTVTNTGRISFWVIVDARDKETSTSQMEYLLTSGRMLKYQLIQETVGNDLSNLLIDCRLFSLNTSNTTENAIVLSETQETPKTSLNLANETIDFVTLQQALAMVILSKESPLKRCADDHTSIMLSSQQAEVLMHKEKVNYICGPAGSGKSLTAICLYKMYGKDHSVYICTTKEYMEFLKFNECTGTRVSCDQELLVEIKRGNFENKTCIIIDDCHNFTCSRASLGKLFKLLKKSRNMSLFVFADNDYQAFNRKRQRAIHDCIVDLTREVFKTAPAKLPLTDIYRNTRKVVSFLQAAIQDIYDGYQKIHSANGENGEGVECIRVTNLWEDTPENGLVVYLRSLRAYNPTEIAILLDPHYAGDEIEQCKLVLANHIPDFRFQRADIFPRSGVVVDCVERFIGLDAAVCVFVLSHKQTRKRSVHPFRKCFQIGSNVPDMSIYNPRYEVFLASRAIYKAVFVVPEINEDIVHQMKFDYLLAPVEWEKLSMATKYQATAIFLWGLCYHDNKLYCVESHSQEDKYTLCMYKIGARALELLDLTEITAAGADFHHCCPRVDGVTHSVYVPCGSNGVWVYRCEDNHLKTARVPLMCVEVAQSVAVHSPTTLLVCNAKNDSVCLVNVTTDSVIMKFQKPKDLGGIITSVAVVGDSILVCYDRKTLVMHHIEEAIPARVLQTPGVLNSVYGITTDGHSRFLVTEGCSWVHVLDSKGNFRHRLYVGHLVLLSDSTLVESELWVGCYCSGISVLAAKVPQ